MEKFYMLKLFRDLEEEGIKEHGGGGKFKNDIFDIF
jgi:hypothetical protein